MRQATFETYVDPDGTITLLIPREIALPGQKVLVTVRPKQTSAEEMDARRKSLEALEGSIPDLEYVRGSEGKPRDIEPLD